MADDIILKLKLSYRKTCFFFSVLCNPLTDWHILHTELKILLISFWGSRKMTYTNVPLQIVDHMEIISLG